MHNDLPMPDTRTLIGSKAVCGLLDIDRSTLIRWVAEGHVPFVHKNPGSNGAYVFDLEVIEKFAADLQTLAAAAPGDTLPGLEVGR